MKKYVALGEPSPLLKESLIDRGYSVIDLPRFSLLSEPIGCHADMLFFHIAGKLFTSSAYYAEAKNEIDLISKKLGAELTLDVHGDYSKYPDEARFNLLRLGGNVFGNKRSASPLILDYLKSESIPFIHVNQGYAACSSAVCGGGIITSDVTLYQAAVSAGAPALRISEGHILLPGYSYGFIGGASGYSAEDNTLYFNGDITAHPDYLRILAFADAFCVRIVSLGSWELTDCGGIFFF